MAKSYLDEDDEIEKDDSSDNTEDSPVSEPAEFQDALPESSDQSQAVEEEAEQADIDAERALMPSGPEEITQQANEIMPEPISSPAQRYESLLSQYAALQRAKNQGLGTNAMLAGGAQIGQALAGQASGNFKPDLTGIEMLNKLDEEPVSDFEKQQKMTDTLLQLQQSKDMADPTSTVSRAYRSYFQQKFPNIPINDNTTAVDLQQLIKGIGKPAQSSFQQVYGTLSLPNGGKQQISAKFDKATGLYYDMSGNQLGPEFVKDFAMQYIKDPATGEYKAMHKNMPDTGVTVTGPKVSGAPLKSEQIETPTDLWNSLDSKSRDRLDKEYRPSFNKATEKTRQRLTHVDVIMQRLKEAQTNPAALAQLKAEMARFDVGDQRLAQQEFDMFAKRYGYKGFQDWLSTHTKGTILPDFAKDMAHAVLGVSKSLKNELSIKAEEEARLLQQRLPKSQQVGVEKIAPLIYGEYQPTLVKVIDKKTKKPILLPKNKVSEARQKGLID